MDTHFSDSTNYYQTNSRQSLAPLSSLEPYQLHQSGLAAPHTLPPLQPQHATLSSAQDLFGQNRQSPRPSQHTHIPGSTTPMGSYGHYAPQASTRYNGAQPSYIQPAQSYQPPQNYLPQFSNAPSYQKHVATMPPHSRLPDLRPMPAGGLHQPSMLSSSYGQSQQLPPPSSIAEQEIQPTHVVGSQGRRGILPSAAGRPPAVAGEGTASAKSAPVPTKDAEGKFPCPHCNKTYLHAKHLKRHLLRRKFQMGNRHHFRFTDTLQILVIDRTCVYYVKIPSLAATSSSGTFRSVLFGEAIQRVLATFLTHKLMSKSHSLEQTRSPPRVPVAPICWEFHKRPRLSLCLLYRMPTETPMQDYLDNLGIQEAISPYLILSLELIASSDQAVAVAEIDEA